MTSATTVWIRGDQPTLDHAALRGFGRRDTRVLRASRGRATQQLQATPRAMAKIVFLGAGSVVFAKNLLGDVLSFGSLADAEIALVDVDA